jgi:hypothetical protein
MCRPVWTIKPPEAGDAIELYNLPWRGDLSSITAVSIDETREHIVLPRQDIIAFGRLDTLADGTRANDVVLTHPVESAQRAISRWHFELRRTRSGYVLRSLSNQLTEVGGNPVGCNEEVPVHEDSVVRIANVLTLHFHGAERPQSVRDAITMQHESRTSGLHRAVPSAPATPREVEHEESVPTWMGEKPGIPS